jgi:hypothetical protein
MKKYIFAFLFVCALSVSSHTAFAATQCTDPLGPNYVVCGGNGNPALVVGGWGTMNGDVPAMKQGDISVDAYGIPSICQFATGCVDTSHTAWHDAIIAALKSQLGDAQFNYWVSLMKKM